MSKSDKEEPGDKTTNDSNELPCKKEDSKKAEMTRKINDAEVISKNSNKNNPKTTPLDHNRVSGDNLQTTSCTI